MRNDGFYFKPNVILQNILLIKRRNVTFSLVPLSLKAAILFPKINKWVKLISHVLRTYADIQYSSPKEESVPIISMGLSG